MPATESSWPAPNSLSGDATAVGASTASTVTQTWLPVCHCDRAVDERAQADLGALQVGQHGDRAARGVGGRADQLVGALVVLVRAVAEVQPGDVHPGLDEGGDLLV